MTNIRIHQEALSRYLDSLLTAGDEELPSMPAGQSSTDVHAPEPAVEVVQEPGSTVVSDALSLLSFEVADVPLAISQNDILSIVEVQDEAISKARESSGTIRIKEQGRDIAILDMREIVFPKEHPARNVERTMGKVHVLVLKNFAYGLLCDGVGDPLHVTPLDVEWRSRPTSRPWLVGMIKGFDCALLDAEQIVHIYSTISH